jgi:Fe-S cluster assembly protein SufD
MHTRIAAGADEPRAPAPGGHAAAGQPRMVLRPHLEILHDRCRPRMAPPGARCPEDALFYARQRGLDDSARA